MSAHSLKFVSEEEVVEQRQRRQAEWEKVRKEDDPEECPEEETRTLFEQLQANKNVKEKEFEDETRLRSSVKGLDDEEVHFLNYVSNRQMQLEKERTNEEKSLIKEMEAAKVIKMGDKTKETKASPDKNAPSTATSSSGGKKSQLQLLSGAIKRKSVDTDAGDEAKKTKVTESEEHTAQRTKRPISTEVKPDAKLMAGLPKGTGAAVVGGILPGISSYYGDDDDSTDSNSSDSDDNDLIVYPSTVTQRVIHEMVKKIKNG